MKHLFVYGSLMFDEVLNRVIKGRYKKLNAQVFGYQRLKVRGDVYPGLVKARSSSTAGVLILNIKQSDLDLLDKFEGKLYQRLSVPVVASGVCHKADVYLFRNRFRHRLANVPWDVEKFKNNGIRAFLKKYPGF